MKVYVGLVMLTACFCHSGLSQVECNCALTRVNWLAACIALRVVGSVLVVVLLRCQKFAQLSSQWETRADI